MICFSMPDGGAAWKTPQPAVTPAPATASTAAAAAAACFVVNSLVFLPLTALFSPRGGKRKRVFANGGKVRLGILIQLAWPGRYRERGLSPVLVPKRAAAPDCG